jgi:hypothetical protein
LPRFVKRGSEQTPIRDLQNLIRSQSYDRELQRQRRKNLQRHKYIGILERFENEKFSSTLKKRSSLLQRWRCSCM